MCVMQPDMAGNNVRNRRHTGGLRGVITGIDYGG